MQNMKSLLAYMALFTSSMVLQMPLVTVRTNFCTSVLAAELYPSAIRLALEAFVRRTLLSQAVILTNCREASLRLQSSNMATFLCWEVIHARRSPEHFGWVLELRWIPSHVGVSGNERACAIRAHAYDKPTIILWLC